MLLLLSRRLIFPARFKLANPPLLPSAVADSPSLLSTVTLQFQTFYYIFDDVVAFVCNRGVLIGIADGTYGDMLVQITDTCGLYIAGTYQTIDGYGTNILYGYMQYWDGLDFCANADNSHARSC
ncbi:hypothetical protein V1523DRAFT_417876 [Lipomyces doorenjongii]